MPAVNFHVNTVLKQRIDEVIEDKGFQSQAELFRTLVIRYLDEENKLPLDNNSNITFLTRQLEIEMLKKFKNKKLSSLTTQLARLKKT